MDLVSGWSDDEYVYLCERPNDSDDVRVRRVRGTYSAFFTGLDDADRLALQRMREVVGLSTSGQYTRVNFKNRWARKDITWKLGECMEGARAAGYSGAAILEADVNPLRRFLSDYGSINISTNPRLAWFDIETDSRCSFFDAVENGKARILCWAITTLRNGEAVRVAEGLLEADTDAAERALIEQFLEACRPFDVLLAWSGDGFDFPVMEARARIVRARPRGMPPNWSRWCFLDCLEVFRKYHAHVHESGEEKTSFKLNSIANALLGEGKKEFAASRTWEAWFAGGAARRQLLDYNIQDSLLMPKIEAKTGYIALHIAVCAVTRCFPDSRSLGAAAQGDGFLLRLGDVHGHRWPTKRHVEEVEQYAGAFVMEPSRVGIIENVHVADFASLYPSIIRSWNISPETSFMWGTRRNTTHGQDISEHGGWPACVKLPYTDTLRFTKAARGMFPRALDELVARRAEYSKRQDAAEPGSPEWERYKRLSGAYKIVANSFYGIMGSPWTRFFSATAAEAVTQTGAWLIKHVSKVSMDAGLEAFYGDTDSVFVSGDGQRFTQVVADLNETWEPILTELGCDDCYLKLEFEKSYQRIVLVSAKRYIGRFSVYKGKQVAGTKIEVKGLEYKRGDTMRLTRQMQKELIDLLLAGEKVPTIEQAHDFVEGWKTRVLEGDLTVDDIVLSQSVKNLDEYKERFTAAKCTGGDKKKKCTYSFGSTAIEPGMPVQSKCPRCGAERKRAAPSVHVRVAKILAERGEEVRSGTRIEYLIVSHEGEKIDAVPARDPGALERIDRENYWVKRIYPPTARVLECAFPNEPWTETPAERKKRKKAEETEKNRGVVNDLPLFAAMAPVQAKIRSRRKKQAAG